MAVAGRLYASFRKHLSGTAVPQTGKNFKQPVILRQRDHKIFAVLAVREQLPNKP